MQKTQFYDILQGCEFHKTLVWSTNSQNLEPKIESKNKILETSNMGALELQNLQMENSQIISKIVLKTQMVADYELTNLAFALTIAQNLSVETCAKIQTEMIKNPDSPLAEVLSLPTLDTQMIYRYLLDLLPAEQAIALQQELDKLSEESQNLLSLYKAELTRLLPAALKKENLKPANALAATSNNQID